MTEDPTLEAPTVVGESEGTENLTPPETEGEPVSFGQSQELPEEYRPYSQIPWEYIPEEIRPQVLEGVKKIQGGVTRRLQEIKELEKQAAEWRQKAEVFDQLSRDPAFLQWYSQRLQGGTGQSQAPQPQPQESPATAPSLEELTELGLEPQAVKKLEQALESKVQQAVKPLTDQLNLLLNQVVKSEMDRRLSELRALAKERGWPSPDEKLSQIYQVLTEGKATDLEAAYKLVIFDELPELLSRREREQIQKEMQAKAQASVPPSSGPAGVPRHELYYGQGQEPIWKALQAAKRELLQRR